MRAPGMTFADPPDTQVDAFERTPLGDGFDHILGAGWLETAVLTQDRGQ